MDHSCWLCARTRQRGTRRSSCSTTCVCGTPVGQWEAEHIERFHKAVRTSGCQACHTGSKEAGQCTWHPQVTHLRECVRELREAILEGVQLGAHALRDEQPLVGLEEQGVGGSMGGKGSTCFNLLPVTLQIETCLGHRHQHRTASPRAGGEGCSAHHT